MSCTRTKYNQLPFWHGRAVRRGSVTFWAWVISIAVHLIVLTAFGVVQFSPCRRQAVAKEYPIAMAKVRQIKKFVQAVPVIPKPRVKKRSRRQFIRKIDKVLPANRIFDIVKPCPRNSASFAKPSTPVSGLSLASSGILPKGIEFFGSWTDRRKVCYLVDYSGSMQGMFGRVRKELKDSVQNLQPDQYFCIIFFGNDRLFEFGNGRLLRATEKAKSGAYDFVDTVQPCGQTNALAALERAMQIRDGSGFGPSVIYFLTDGFELTTKDAQRFPQKIANLLKRFSPTTKINTIGFWPQDNDRKMLEVIAKQSGGEFVFVADSSR